MATMGICTNAPIGTPLNAADGTALECAPSIPLKLVSTQELQAWLNLENSEQNQQNMSEAWSLGFATVLGIYIVALAIGKALSLLKR